MNRLRAIVGPRRTQSPAVATSWLIALVVLTVVIPANDKIGSNAVFFTAHSFSPVAWVIELILFTTLSWLIVWAILRLAKRHDPTTFDVVATGMTFAVTSFFVSNAVNLALTSAPGPSPIIGLVSSLIGLLASAVITWLARAFAMGNVLLLVSALAAAVPLFATATQQSEALATTFAFPADAPRPNVVWVIADELSYPLVMDRDGRVRDQFPNLQRLQRTATTYTRTYTSANFTDYAVPAQLSGISNVTRIPKAEFDRVRANVGIVPGFAADYSIVMESPMYGFECDSEACASVGADADAPFIDRAWMFTKDVSAVIGKTVLAPPFSNAFPTLDGRWRDYWGTGDEFGENEDVDTVGAVIDGITHAKEDAPTNPFFALWHSIRTHGPWVVDADFKQMFPARVPIVRGSHMVGNRRNETVATDELEALNRRLYVDSARDLDRQVGELIDALEAAGTFDDTLFIFTSDHGVAVTRQKIRRVGDTEVQQWSEIAHVPLLVKDPDQTKPQVVTAVRSTGQIAATVLQVTRAGITNDLTLDPPLTEDLPGGPVFATVTTRGATGHPFPDVVEVDPWTPDDLGPDQDNPYALGIDLNRIGTALPAGAVEQKAELRMLPGVSRFQLLVADRAQTSCPTSTGLVTNGENGQQRIIGSVLWEGRDGKRGWALVPKAQQTDYRLWCS